MSNLDFAVTLTESDLDRFHPPCPVPLTREEARLYDRYQQARSYYIRIAESVNSELARCIPDNPAQYQLISDMQKLLTDRERAAAIIIDGFERNAIDSAASELHYEAESLEHHTKGSGRAESLAAFTAPFVEYRRRRCVQLADASVCDTMRDTLAKQVKVLRD